MGATSGKINLQDITQEQIEQFYNFLQGELPKELSMKRPPHLSGKMAFRVIYYLQEVMGILPDNFERCKTCGSIFDTGYEGNSETLHCDNCRRD